MDKQLEITVAQMQELITCAIAGAKGYTYTPKIEWETLVRIAHEHNVLPLVALAIDKDGENGCPEGIRCFLSDSMHNIASRNLLKEQRILQLLHDMDQAGLGMQVLKGYAVSRYYCHPECRESVDTDLLISPDDEERVQLFLQNKGFCVQERNPTRHHAVYQHAKYGKIEVHVSLYDEIVENIWFQNVGRNEVINETFEKVVSPSGVYYTLGPTDHLIFLSLHMVKHFISSGLTIRMMLDVALYFSNNCGRIDAKRFWTVMDKLGYADLLNCIFSIVIASGMFDAKEFPLRSEIVPLQTSLLLQDLALGGYMGIKEKAERHEGSMEYNRRIYRKNNGPLKYRLYMLKWKIRSAWKNANPSAKELQKLFPVTRQHKLTAHFLRIIYMFTYIVGKVRNGILRKEIRSSNMQLHDIAKRRIELFETMKML